MIFKVLEKSNIQSPGALLRKLIKRKIKFLNGWIKRKDNKLLNLLDSPISNLIIGEIKIKNNAGGLKKLQ